MYQRRHLTQSFYALTILFFISDGLYSINVEAFSASSSSSSSRSSTSPWAAASWKLTLNIGREKDSDMDSKWGASGGRLVLPMEVSVESDPCKISNNFVGRGASVLSFSAQEENPTTYITMKGEQKVIMDPIGGWTMEFPPGGKKGLATTLKFWMKMETALERNDIQLDANSILCGQGNCWRETDYDIGLRKMRPIQLQADEAQRRLDEQLSHESGDRRLDGSDAMETLKGYKDMAQLVLDRDIKLQQKQQALQKYPPVPKNIEDEYDDELPEGPWPGDEEWLTLSAVGNPLYVLQSSLLGEECQLIGTWTVTPIFSDDEDIDE